MCCGKNMRYVQCIFMCRYLLKLEVVQEHQVGKLQLYLSEVNYNCIYHKKPCASQEHQISMVKFYLSSEAVPLQELLIVTLQFHMAISVLQKHQVCTMQLQLSLKCQYKGEQVLQYNIIVSIGSTTTRTHICYNYIDHLT